MKKEWDNVADKWNSAMGEGDWFQKYLIYPTIENEIGNLSEVKILDVGCGNGHLSRYLKNKGATVCGIDNSEKMIDVCKSYGDGIEYYRSDVTAERVKESYFKYAILNNSVQDMPQYEDGLKNVYKMLEDNGKMIIIVKHPCFHPESKNLGWKLLYEDGTQGSSGQGLTDVANDARNFEAEYFMTDNYYSTVGHTREWFGTKTTSFSRTLEDYFSAITKSGFTIEKLSEPKPVAEGKAENGKIYSLLMRIPNFILFKAVKAGKNYEH